MQGNFDPLFSVAGQDRALQKRFNAKFAYALAVSGWTTVAAALSSIALNALPARLADPSWQLEFISALLSASGTLLLGVILVLTPCLFSGRNRPFLAWGQRAGVLASVLAAVMLAAVPLQFYSGNKALNAKSAQTAAEVKNLQAIAQRISVLQSELELRTYVATLPNAPALPERFDAPFPVIQKRAIQNIQSQINAGNTNLLLQKASDSQIFFKQFIRNTIQCVLMAAAFSALASSTTNKPANPIVRLFSKVV